MIFIFNNNIIRKYALFHYHFNRRAVIFRLGRLLKGGAKGPGLFIV